MSSSAPGKLLIVIPTYNRAGKVERAARAALQQECDDITVAVIDDGSKDDTKTILSRFFDDPRFVYIGLEHNVGTARAKNVALGLLPFEAITFHDSDDVPFPTKLLRQSRILNLPAVHADPCLNWNAFDIATGSTLPVSVVLTEHMFIAADGAQHRMKRALSLVDDFFPHLQMAAGPPGDWILVNSGLFRRSVFARHGGYENCIEEDRELRNRLIMAGEVIWLIDEPLMTKIDQSDSLTAHSATGYASSLRQRDRDDVWARIARWRKTGAVPHVPLDLSDIALAHVSNPKCLRVPDDIPMTGETRENLVRQLTSAQAQEAMYGLR